MVESVNLAAKIWLFKPAKNARNHAERCVRKLTLGTHQGLPVKVRVVVGQSQ